jgi:hypothetical protein
MKLQKTLLKKIATQIGKVYDGDVYFSAQPLTCLVSYPSDPEAPTQKPGGSFELPFQGEAKEGCENFKIGINTLKNLLKNKGKDVVLTPHYSGDTWTLQLGENQEYVTPCDFHSCSHYDYFMAYHRRTHGSHLRLSTDTGIDTLVKGLEATAQFCKNNWLGEAGSLATLTWGERDYPVSSCFSFSDSDGVLKAKPWVLTMTDGLAMVAYGGKILAELSQGELPYLPYGQGEINISPSDAKLILDRINVCKTKKSSEVSVSFDLSETSKDYGVVIKERRPNSFGYENVEATLVLANPSKPGSAPKHYGTYFRKRYEDTERYVLPAGNPDTLVLEGFTGDELSAVLAPKAGNKGDFKATDILRLAFYQIDDVSKKNREWFLEFGVSSDSYTSSEKNAYRVQAEESRPGCSGLTLTPITNRYSGSAQAVGFDPVVHKGFCVSFGFGAGYQKNPYYQVLANLPPELVVMKTDGRVFSFETNTVGNAFTDFCWILWKPRHVKILPS